MISCFKGDQQSIENKRPAIICSHRVNFIVQYFQEIEMKILNYLRIFKKILKKWPDVEFMTSDQLGELIEKGI